MAQVKYLSSVNPLLAAIFPVLFLYAQNADEVDPLTALFAALVVVAGAAILLLLLWFLLRDAVRASFVACIWLALFFAYGHIFEMLSDKFIGEFIVGRHRYLLAGTLGVAILSLWVAIRTPRITHHVTPYITAVLTILIAFNIATLAAHQIRISSALPPQHDVTGEISLPKIPAQEMPDIYYIIFDGYAREDVLRDLFKFDNSSFLNYLRRNDFYVSSDSRSNYVLTYLSLASALNMEYLEFLRETVGADSKDLRILSRMTRENKVMQIAKKMGYRIVHLLSNWDAGIWAGAFMSNQKVNGQFIPRRGNSLGRVGQIVLRPILKTEFGSTLLKSTILRTFIAQWIRYADTIAFVENMDLLASITEMEGPTFTFAHFLPPHPPYLFDRNGNVRKLEEYSLQKWKEKELYIDQLVWVNKAVKDAIDHILRNNKHKSVIVLQGDHGSEFSGSFVNPNKMFIWERTSNLYATHLPKACRSNSLYQSITPVNTFRQIFNDCLGTKFEQLEDKTFWSNYERPYDFVRIEKLLN